MRKIISKKSWLIPLGVLIISLWVTFFAWQLSKQTIEQQASIKFENEVNRTMALFEDRLHLLFNSLYSTRGLFNVRKTETLDWEEWTAFIDPETIATRFPSVKAIRFIQRVKAGEKTAFLQFMHGETRVTGTVNQNFKIFPEGERDEYYVIKYLEPYEGNEPNHGFDVLSESVREEAFERARDTGQVTATKRITLLTDVGKDEPSFLLILPIYRYGADISTVENRREALYGFVDIACRIQDFVTHVFEKKTLGNDIDFDVFDSPTVTSEHQIFTNIPTENLVNADEIPKFSAAKTLNIGGQIWTLRFQSLSNFRLGPVQRSFSRFVFAVGMIFSFLLFGLLLSFSTSRFRAERLAEKMTVDLRLEVGERKRAEGQAKEALKIKSEFVSMVSHELRTPLTVIKESLAIVQDGSVGTVSSEQKDFLETARKNVERLSRLINDVLDFQKLESGHLELNRNEVDINAVAKETVQDFALVAQNKGLNLSLQADSSLPEINADHDKITQVLGNLINNAIKFSEKGTITVKTVKNKDRIRVSVQDEGPGIREEDIPRLFQSFSQIQTTGAENTGGTGLGLVISKKIIEAHRGEIGVESVYGQGSTFYFTLPVH